MITINKLDGENKGEFREVYKSLDDKGKLALMGAIGNSYWVIREDDKCLGCAVLSESEWSITIAGLAIHQDYRGIGNGHKVVELFKNYAEEESKKLITCVLSESSIDFFEGCGFKIVGHEPGEVWLGVDDKNEY